MPRKDDEAVPRPVWAALFALVAAMIGLGLVTPLLREISIALDASSSQTLLLITGYVVVLGLAMPFSSAVSGRLGPRRTLVGALLLTAGCAGISGFAQHVELLIACRLGWGLGNALFLATVLAAIVQHSGPSATRSIRLFEATVGVGIAAGPHAGGRLGAISWRLALLGSALVLAAAALLLLLLMPAGQRTDGGVDVLAPFRLLARPGFLVLGVLAIGYNAAFLTLFSFSPFALALPTAQVGLVYFGWGLALVVGSLALAAPVHARLGTRGGLVAAIASFGVVLAGMALGAHLTLAVATGVVISGVLIGIGNSLLTDAVMTSAAPDDSAVRSAAYNFLRNAPPAVAPWVAGRLYEAHDVHAPYVFAMVAAGVAVTVLLVGRPRPRSVSQPVPDLPHLDPVD
jgi:predicted MFS family arabinose efflux permease